MMEARRTLVLVNLAGIMERADEAMLPAVYKEVGAALHATPAGLGTLTFFRSIVQSACYPLAAYMALRYDRTHVIAIGAVLWAAATFLVAISSTYLQVAIWRGLNGVGLALVTPAIQSLVADCTDDVNRGSAFGWLQLTGSIGSMLGGTLSFMLASSTFLGVEGWRVAFHLVAIVSVIVGILVRLFAIDPNFTVIARKTDAPSFRNSVWAEVRVLAKEAMSVMKTKSFQIIVVQGVAGSLPWSALLFAPMWLELLGFSRNMTGFLIMLFVIASSLGGLLGGKMGDFLAKRFPDSGRIVTSQISSGLAIPLAAVLMLGLPGPAEPSSGFVHALFFFILGLSISWNSAATNNPIFAEIVPEKSRTSIYALDRSIESTLSSCATPLVGILAQYVYGYKPIGYETSEDTNVAIDRGNAAALAKALCTIIAAPMGLCCIMYSFLYCSYPRDRDRVRMDALMEGSEMQESPFKAESDMLLKEGKKVKYGDEFEVDGDREEKTLLSR